VPTLQNLARAAALALILFAQSSVAAPLARAADAETAQAPAAANTDAATSGNSSSSATTSEKPAPPAKAEAPAKVELPPEVVARVNGQDITRAELADRLLKYYGEGALNSFIQQVLIRQEAKALNISASDRDVDEALNDFYTFSTFPQGMPLTQRKKVWRELLEARGLTEDEFRGDLEVEVLLKKIVRRRIQLTDEQMQTEFKRRYGERLRLSQIVVAKKDEAEKARQRLESGESFADLARSLSTDRRTAIDGGKLLLPFSRGQSARIYEDVAYALAVGEISLPFEMPDGWYLLKLEGRLPGDNVKFDDVKDRVREELLKTEELRLRPAVLGEITRKARIDKAPLAPRNK
jgi:foldase protein PrsA